MSTFYGKEIEIYDAIGQLHIYVADKLQLVKYTSGEVKVFCSPDEGSFLLGYLAGKGIVDYNSTPLKVRYV